MSDLTGIVDQLLAERRPDRYETEGGDGWLDEIAGEIEDLVPEAEARARYASTIVRNREGQKTKSTNRQIREIYRSGQLPLDWLDTMNLPLAVGKERVALRAVKAEDFEAFAVEERRAAGRDFAARNETCEAAEWLAEHMRATGTGYGRDLNLGDD